MLGCRVAAGIDFIRVKSHCFGSMQEDKLDGQPGSKPIPRAATSMIKRSWMMISGPDVSFDALNLYDFLLFQRAIALDVGVFSQH